MAAPSAADGPATPPRAPARRRRRLRRVVLAGLLLPLLAAAWATLVEPHWLEVTEEDVPQGLSRKLTICHLTDLHLEAIGGYEESVLARIAARRPELVVVTGDCVDKGGRYDVAAEFLRRIEAPLGVWVVRGNWEHWRPSEGEREVYAAAGARLLVNEAARIRNDVWLVGLDDFAAGRPDAEKAFADVPAGAYVVALFHSPEYFPQVAGRCALAFAGHTHGGQVYLPLIGPPWLPRGSGRYVAGWYEERGSRMYVARGIGTSILPVRFNCRPEMAFFTLRPSGSSAGGR